MIQMLTCCNLRTGVTVDRFRHSLAEFAAHLERLDLLHSAGPVSRRQRDTLLDTDEERDQEFFFMLSFRDRQQRDRAVAHVFELDAPGGSIHQSLYALVDDPVFTCWEHHVGDVT